MSLPQPSSRTSKWHKWCQSPPVRINPASTCSLSNSPALLPLSALSGLSRPLRQPPGSRRRPSPLPPVPLLLLQRLAHQVIHQMCRALCSTISTKSGSKTLYSDLRFTANSRTTIRQQGTLTYKPSHLKEFSSPITTPSLTLRNPIMPLSLEVITLALETMPCTLSLRK